LARGDYQTGQLQREAYVTALGIFSDALTLPEHHTGDLEMEAMAMRNKACALRDLGRHIEAIEVCDSAARLHPDSFVKTVQLRASMRTSAIIPMLLRYSPTSRSHDTPVHVAWHAMLLRAFQGMAIQSAALQLAFGLWLSFGWAVSQCPEAHLAWHDSRAFCRICCSKLTHC